MLELTDFDDSKISYLARISRGHHVDTLLVPREYKDTFESTELYKVLLPNISIGKGYWRGSKYLYVCNNNTIYLLGSDAGIHHVTEELPSNLEAKVREYKP